MLLPGSLRRLSSAADAFRHKRVHVYESDSHAVTWLQHYDSDMKNTPCSGHEFLSNTGTSMHVICIGLFFIREHSLSMWLLCLHHAQACTSKLRIPSGLHAPFAHGEG